MTIRVLVVDDHVLFRDGMVSLLIAAGYDVVGEASNGQEMQVAATTLGACVAAGMRSFRNSYSGPISLLKED